MNGEKNKISPSGNSEFYDESAGYDDETGVRFAEGLSDEDKRKATIIYRLFNGLWGLCIVKGDPGTGKDLFGNYLTYKIKTYFPWKRVLRDEKPRRLYGNYAGLFNEEVLSEDFKKMDEISKGKTGADALESAADDWIKGAGEVMLKNSALYLTEFWRYCYNREPHKFMNKTMGAVHKFKRHLDCLIIGTSQLPSELDKKTCLKWVDWEVTCTKSVVNRTGYVYYIQKVKYDRRKERFDHLGRPYPMAFDAGKPRAFLGDGLIHIKKSYYQPETEEEEIVLNVLKAGINTYEGIVEFIDSYGDMTETEVLDTLKDLKFKRHKRVLDYPCYFGIFNSKSAMQNVSGKVKMDE